MIGLITSLLFEFVEQNWGKEVALQIRADSGVPADQAFHMHTYYDDEQWRTIWRNTVQAVNMETDALEWEFGWYSGEALTTQFSGFMAGITSARQMIVRQPKIHNSLSMSIADPAHRKSINEKFYLEETPDTTIMHYASPNRMCVYYKSLAHYVAEAFNEDIQLEEHACLKHGADECTLHIRYLGSRA